MLRPGLVKSPWSLGRAGLSSGPRRAPDLWPWGLAASILSRMVDLALSSNRVITRDGPRAATVVVVDGVIERVAPRGTDVKAVRTVDAGNLVVMPGVMDVHVHVNEPGRTDWEGFATATAAAAAGGITTLVDMPLNSSPVTTTPAAVQAKLDESRGKCLVDYGFWGGVVPDNRGALDGLLEAGVLGCKCFLVPSGIDDFPQVSEPLLRHALPHLAQRRQPLLVHAEMPGPIATATESVAANATVRRYEDYLASRPRAAEHEAIDLVIRLCREFGSPMHVVHLSSADALPMLSAARSEGVPLTVETCPHYLTFAAEDIPDGATPYKCAPPIRERENRERLWGGLADGTIDLVASDHSPSPPALKCLSTGDFMRAWGGIASLQLLLPATWTGARGHHHGLSDLVHWLCRAPARLAGLSHRKGEIAPGMDGDLVLWDPDEQFVVRGAALHHRHPLTPYEGRTLAGVVHQTFLRGRCVFDEGQLAHERFGQHLQRTPA